MECTVYAMNMPTTTTWTYESITGKLPYTGYNQESNHKINNSDQSSNLIYN